MDRCRLARRMLHPRHLALFQLDLSLQVRELLASMAQLLYLWAVISIDSGLAESPLASMSLWLLASPPIEYPSLLMIPNVALPSSRLRPSRMSFI